MARTFRNWPGVAVLPYALSSRPGQSFIQSAGICSRISAAGPGTPIQVETLDRLFAGPLPAIRFIKADLEGFDLEALEGAREIIARDAPRISVTTYHHPEHARQIADFLMRLQPHYRIRTRGIYQETGAPVMLQAWCE